MCRCRHLRRQLALSNLPAISNLLVSQPLRDSGAVREAVGRALERHREDRLTGGWTPVYVTSESLIGDGTRRRCVVLSIQVRCSIRVVGQADSIPVNRTLRGGKWDEEALPVVEAKEIRCARAETGRLVELTIFPQCTRRVSPCRQHLIGIVQPQANATEPKVFAAGAG